jgi:hypothetical protein
MNNIYEGYDCVSTKPDIDEIFIAHYGVKGMKWHKRLKGKYYSAKSKLKEMTTKARRKIEGIDPDEVTEIVKKRNWEGRGVGTVMLKSGYRDTGRGLATRTSSSPRTSYDRNDIGPWRKDHVNIEAGLEAGRERARKRKKK